ncbi:unnamed protein product [Macrosiphum euphorbiae]|uniref:MULE transposase domain-containing protein n=1 Tax=Macrosiphum euphorbiae TaxID=13131 RepID=A0AAV0Y9V9_9HEMI|nr:unnamed protein product [Macrosiphum euphorbiae]
MEIIKSNKGGNKGFYKGYVYVVKYIGVSKITWRCSQRCSMKCTGELYTDLKMENPEVKTGHSHLKDDDSVKIEKALCAMKERSKAGLSKPLEVYAAEISKLDGNTRAKLPVEDHVKRTLRNQRSALNPVEPTSLDNLVIDDEWCTTGHPEYENFLIFDNGINSEERILIFGTVEGMNNLSKSNTWYLDGNFSLAPKLFLQLYVIRVEVDGIFITAIYCLLQKKTSETYKTVFRTLVEKCAEQNLYLDPKYVHLDFEKAVIKAVHKIFNKEVIIRGCFYHLSQSTHRKIQALGLEKLYHEDPNFTKFCGMLDGLAFLPLTDVEQGMSYLRSIMPDTALDLVEYFDSTYVNGTFKRTNCPINKIKFKKVQPRFPPSVWNVHEATLNDQHRTNNTTEGWNHRFSNLVGHNHPSIWTLLKKMRLEVAVDDTKIRQYNLGTIQPVKKRKLTVKNQNTLKRLCVDYNEGKRSIENFLDAISYNTRIKLD